MTRSTNRRTLTALIMAAALLAGGAGPSLSCLQCSAPEVQGMACHVASGGDMTELACSCCCVVAPVDFAGPVAVLGWKGQSVPDAPVVMYRAMGALPTALSDSATRTRLPMREMSGPPIYLLKHSYLI